MTEDDEKGYRWETEYEKTWFVFFHFISASSLQVMKPVCRLAYVKDCALIRIVH